MNCIAHTQSSWLAVPSCTLPIFGGVCVNSWEWREWQALWRKGRLSCYVILGSSCLSHVLVALFQSALPFLRPLGWPEWKGRPILIQYVLEKSTAGIRWLFVCLCCNLIWSLQRLRVVWTSKMSAYWRLWNSTVTVLMREGNWNVQTQVLFSKRKNFECTLLKPTLLQIICLQNQSAPFGVVWMGMAPIASCVFMLNPQ